MPPAVWEDMRDSSGSRARIRCSAPDRLTDFLLNPAVPYVSVVELRHHWPTASDLSEDGVAGATDVILHVGEGLFQTLAMRREAALERDDLLPYVQSSRRHRLFSSIPSRASRWVLPNNRAVQRRAAARPYGGKLREVDRIGGIIRPVASVTGGEIVFRTRGEKRCRRDTPAPLTSNYVLVRSGATVA
jgi:hypothetical protein